MLYAAKCYWPGVSVSEFERAPAIRLSDGRAGDPDYIGSLVFSEDALVLCLFEGSSPAAVMQTARRARIPCERIMQSQWVSAAGSPLTTSGGLP
jgi:hypothetical protein